MYDRSLRSPGIYGSATFCKAAFNDAIPKLGNGVRYLLCMASIVRVGQP